MANFSKQDWQATNRRRDPLLDGYFWVENRETRSYCLPSCRAYPFAESEPEIYSDVEAAKKAGLKACRSCRPSRFLKMFAPGEIQARAMKTKLLGCIDRIKDIGEAVSILDLDQESMADLCQTYYQKTPEAFLTRLRIESVASELRLGSTAGKFDKSIDQKAFAQDFQLVMGQSFERYADLKCQNQWVIQLPESYRQEFVTPYWLRDPSNAIFQYREPWFWRTFQVGQASCLIRARFEKRGFAVYLESSSRDFDRFALYEQIRRILGLDHSPLAFEAQMRKQGKQRLLGDRAGLRIVRTPTVFEALVWTILGQQINLAFAYKLRNRLIKLAGISMGGELYAHPTPEAVAALEEESLYKRQFSRSKVAYLLQISQHITEGKLDLEGLVHQPVTYAERRLLAERGIGQWTARYITMRGCGFEDCVPVGDAGLKNALKTYFDLEKPPQASEVEAFMIDFEPYRSFATFHLWRLLSEN